MSEWGYSMATENTLGAALEIAFRALDGVDADDIINVSHSQAWKPDANVYQPAGLSPTGMNLYSVVIAYRTRDPRRTRERGDQASAT